MAVEGLSAPDMAQRVGTFRQNIENLVAEKVGAPRYLPDLARVMDTSVDVLLAGKYAHPSKRPGPSRSPEAATVKDGGLLLRENTAMGQQVGPQWPFQNYITRQQWEGLQPHERALVEWAAFEELKKVLSARPAVPFGKHRRP